jgi:enoyl-CoA hydratase/carnithine racemase
MAIIEKTEGNVRTIVVNRPAALNAMDETTYDEITQSLRRFDDDPDLSVGIVTGAGDRAFSAGADLKEMHGEDARPDGWRPWRAERWDMGLRVSKPLIAAIDGYAVAGGMELALLCDIRLATSRSQFGAPEVKWNLLHGFGALRLPAVVGHGNAMMLLLTGEFIDAEEALRIGLINRITSPDALMEESHQLAETIASRAPDAIRMTKELAIRGLDTSLEEGMRLYRSYMDALEGNEEQVQRTAEFTRRNSSGRTAG